MRELHCSPTSPVRRLDSLGNLQRDSPVHQPASGESPVVRRAGAEDSRELPMASVDVRKASGAKESKERRDARLRVLECRSFRLWCDKWFVCIGCCIYCENSHLSSYSLEYYRQCSDKVTSRKGNSIPHHQIWMSKYKIALIHSVTVLLCFMLSLNLLMQESCLPGRVGTE